MVWVHLAGDQVNALLIGVKLSVCAFCLGYAELDVVVGDRWNNIGSSVFKCLQIRNEKQNYWHEYGYAIKILQFYLTQLQYPDVKKHSQTHVCVCVYVCVHV